VRRAFGSPANASKYYVRLRRQISGVAAKERRSCIRQITDLPHICSGEAAIRVPGSITFSKTITFGRNTTSSNSFTRGVVLHNRTESLRRLQSDRFDLIVIGGGITGAGISLDAASRGLRVALLEKSDFASGTSSKSTKLIHGGLRYLENLHLALTYEACVERQLLLRLAPHLVEPFPFLIPNYRGFLQKQKLSAGLWLYDLMASLQGVTFHRALSRDEVIRFAPLIERNRLSGGFIYYDCKTDDSRLTLEVIKCGARYGALPINYVEVVEILRERRLATGVKAVDRLTGEIFEVGARSIASATGAWTDAVHKLDDSQAKPMIRPSKGAHLVLPREKLRLETAVLVPSATEDGRFIFAVPWYGEVLLGTTDTDYTGSLDNIPVTNEDVAYLIAATNRLFPEAKITTEDVISSFAGVRPLIDSPGASTTRISREHSTFESPSGVIFVAGGKLTTYRRMAQEVTDRIISRLGLKEAKRCSTERILLSGVELGETADRLRAQAIEDCKAQGLEEDVALSLLTSFGKDYQAILKIIDEDRNLSRRIIGGLPHIRAEVVYACRFELAAKVEDILRRRTRLALLAGNRLARAIEDTAELMGKELDWDRNQIKSEANVYKETVGMLQTADRRG